MPCFFFVSTSIFHIIVYALPSPQQSATLVFFGAGNPQDPTASLVTEFLVPTGTSSGGDQTTFELVEVKSAMIDPLVNNGTATQSQPLTTLTAQVVASSSGFMVDGTFTGNFGIFTSSEECDSTATNGGVCEGVVAGFTISANAATGDPLVIAISTPTSSATSQSSTSSTTSSSNSSPTTVGANGGSKREFDQKMLALVFGTTILGICSGRFLVL
ncbi:hypothetical protein BT96DRAFT_94457 [Gymnopus androsaceus JB14]|uniref:Uncharacterized protein n=1 Tax=Gymnopus androsaceus JB14 TaxID=1447944 RepID=A0A6A4HGD4_9AGAR|nr:hypothetical protein BT96DRAFT_94457 [Gymnopus androsaceus JB14]